MMHDMDHSGHNAQSAAMSMPSQSESLLDVLKRRYALGEISREQFEEMKQVLGVSEAAPAPARSTEHNHERY